MISAAGPRRRSDRAGFGASKIVAPFDGVTGERQVQPGDYVNIGTSLINVVPLPVSVIANYKETQLTHVAPGQPVAITVGSFTHRTLQGRVERISPASGSQFALLPPDMRPAMTGAPPGPFTPEPFGLAKPSCANAGSRCDEASREIGPCPWWMHGIASAPRSMAGTGQDIGGHL